VIYHYLHAVGAKYKPVAKKVIPISTYDPDTIIPEYMPLEPKELPPLTTNPRKMEDIVFTERLTQRGDNDISCQYIFCICLSHDKNPKHIPHLYILKYLYCLCNHIYCLHNTKAYISNINILEYTNVGYA